MRTVSNFVNLRQINRPNEDQRELLMDMQMPVMTGQEAVAELRRLGFELPIIALTADAMDGERDACLAIGCNDYSPKPIDGPALMNLVARHLLNKALDC